MFRARYGILFVLAGAVPVAQGQWSAHAASGCSSYYPAGAIQIAMEKAASIAQLAAEWAFKDNPRSIALWNEAKHYKNQIMDLMDDGRAAKLECEKRFGLSTNADVVAEEAKHANKHRGDSLSKKLTDQALDGLIQTHKKSLGELNRAFANFDKMQANLAPMNRELEMLAAEADHQPNMQAELDALALEADVEGIALMNAQNQQRLAADRERRKEARRAARKSRSTFGRILEGLFTALGGASRGAYSGGYSGSPSGAYSSGNSGYIAPSSGSCSTATTPTFNC